MDCSTPGFAVHHPLLEPPGEPLHELHLQIPYFQIRFHSKIPSRQELAGVGPVDEEAGSSCPTHCSGGGLRSELWGEGGDGAKDRVKSDLVTQLGKELLIIINGGNEVVLVLTMSTYYLTESS